MIYTWFLTNGLKLGGIAVMCLASFFYGCHEEAKNTKAVQAAFDTFVGGVKTAGEKAEADKIAKEKAEFSLLYILFGFEETCHIGDIFKES